MSSDAAAKGPRRNIRIGKYEVLAHVATGGMGAVYKARDTETGHEVALKVLSPEMAAKPGMVERFRREAKHAAKLLHENVVTLHEFCEVKHTYFLVMEFIDGIDLHEYSNRKGALDPQESLEIIVQACRALDHAYEQGVVHRDIKPSNFLLIEQGERKMVKLTDLGLAREASNEEFRVTRAGTTVGTLDYMSPEQARDSGLADIRSDLYSLGSTWYHLLAGHAPFPKGGLGERLHRILHEDPPDIRQANPHVSAAMASVLHRLLAKRPAQRYQTPRDLLRDLEALQRGESLLTPKQALESLALEESESIELPRKKKRAAHRPASSGRRTPPSLPSRSRADTKTSKSTAEVPVAESMPATRPHLWYGLIGAAAIILLLAVAAALSLRRGRHEDSVVEQPASGAVQLPSPPPHVPLTGETAVAPNPLPRPNSLPPRNPDTNPKPRDDAANVLPSKKPSWPVLYRPSQPINAAALRNEIETPWTAPAAPQSTVELVVGRLPPDPSGKTFSSLADACKAIPAGATGIIELRDNGPFFDIPAVLADRSLVLRAAAGYRPLLVWDVQRTLEERGRNRDRRQAADQATPLVFLDVKHGNLTLQDLHIAFQWPDAPSEGAAVLRVEDGDLTVNGCTFSVAGKPRNGVTLVRFTATRPEAGRCRFNRCYARGAKMSVLDLDAPGAHVLFDNCLLVGDDAPLLRLRAANGRPTRLWAARSTMICGSNLLEVRPAKAADHEPAFDWLGWDVLLSRKNSEIGGELLRLGEGISAKQMSWRAINCLYAGWSKLLAASTSISAMDLSAWRRLWKREEGDVALSDPWPAAVFPEPGQTPANAYGTAGSPVAFAASSSAEQRLGCDLDQLPAARDNWLSLTFDRFVILASAAPEDAGPPQIPVASDGLFHGAQVDVSQTDLGDYLQKVQQTYQLAPDIVLHLSGSGEHFTTPLHLKGSNVLLYFDPPADKSEPLVLVPTGRGSAEALFDVEQGNLSIVNGNFRFSGARPSRVVPWLIKMRGGDLRLFRTRLEVPPKDSGDAFRGLIALDGSGDVAAERVRSCIANECILVSARQSIAVQGIGARVQLMQTLLIAGGEAIHLTLDAGFRGKANVQCLLDHATVAARSAVLHLSDVPQAEPPTEPVIVQTHNCAFLNLFHRRGSIALSQTGLVLYDGEALSRGLIVWQSENDAFDHRLWFAAAASSSALPDRIVDHRSWVAVWGTPSLDHPQLYLQTARVLDSDNWSLERLAGAKIPGADLEGIGAFKKPPKKNPR